MQKDFLNDERTAHARGPLLFYQTDDSVAKPLIYSDVPPGTNVDEAIKGSEWLGLSLFEQGLRIAAVLQAKNSLGLPLYDTVAVEAPRRSTKTTAILATLLGRCLERPGYRVASTAQDGMRARFKLQEVMKELRRRGFERAGLGKLHFANGTERIEFANDSVWKAVPPDPGSFRSDAFDVVLIDEAGELDPEKADALMAGLLPTQDTRPESQTIVAGTPNVKARAGLLWDTLQELYDGVAGLGGVVYAAKESDIFADLSDPDNPVYDFDLLRRVHPGIGTLTTLEKVFSRLSKMGLEKWSAEYLCQWPSNAGSSALDIAAWKQCASPVGMPVRPDRIGAAFDIDPDGMNGSLVCAWRDKQGKAHFEVLYCGSPENLAPFCKAVSDKYKTVVAYDAIGQNLDIAESMTRPPYRTKLKALRMRDMIGAAARIAKEIRNQNAVQYEQPDLTLAVEGATWRPAGTDGRLFARKASANSVCTLVAASEALWQFDQLGERRRIPGAVAVAAS